MPVKSPYIPLSTTGTGKWLTTAAISLNKINTYLTSIAKEVVAHSLYPGANVQYFFKDVGRS